MYDCKLTLAHPFRGTVVVASESPIVPEAQRCSAGWLAVTNGTMCFAKVGAKLCRIRIRLRMECGTIYS